MTERTKITSLFVFFAVGAYLAFGSSQKDLVRDGFALSGVEGMLIKTDNNAHCGKWFFEFATDVNDLSARITSGTKMEILPSSTLEKMTAGTEDNVNRSCRLRGRITQYKGNNYIFPRFARWQRVADSGQRIADTLNAKRHTLNAINESEDQLTIPEGIIDKLRTKQVPEPNQLKSDLNLEQDSMLVDRTGFIRKAGLAEKGQSGCEYIFALDALGREIQEIRFILLPCEEMEKAVQYVLSRPEQIRIKAAGIVTKYKGNYYLLLERAVPAYSHQNFGM